MDIFIGLTHGYLAWYPEISAKNCTDFSLLKCSSELNLMWLDRQGEKMLKPTEICGFEEGEAISSGSKESVNNKKGR